MGHSSDRGRPRSCGWQWFGSRGKHSPDARLPRCRSRLGGLFRGNPWIGAAHLALLLVACGFFLECAATELDLLRWSGGLNDAAAGEKLTEATRPEVLSDPEPIPNTAPPALLPSPHVEVRRAAAPHSSRSTFSPIPGPASASGSSEPPASVLKHELMAKLLRMDSSALALTWSAVAFFALRPFFLSETSPASIPTHWLLCEFDVRRLFTALVYLGTIWHVCRAALKLQRSGVWELIRVSPMENRDYLELTLHQAIT